MASCGGDCTDNSKIHPRTATARPKGTLTRLEGCNLKYLKAEKCELHRDERFCWKYTGRPSPALCFTQICHASDSGSRHPWDILEGWSIRATPLSPGAGRPQPQQHRGQAGTHLGCPWQVRRSQTPSLQLPSHRTRDASYPQ